jgi:hypothetical protein
MRRDFGPGDLAAAAGAEKGRPSERPSRQEGALRGSEAANYY